MINSDRVVVVKADGRELGEVRATFTSDLVVIRNVTPQVESGDTLIRKVDGAPDQVYTVLEAIYFAGTGAHYQLKVEPKPAAAV
jgi:hypothetical protein